MLSKAISKHVSHSLYHEWQLVASMNVLAKLKCHLFSQDKWEVHWHICHSAFKTWTHQPRSSTYCKKSIFLTVITNHKCDSDFSWGMSHSRNVSVFVHSQAIIMWKHSNWAWRKNISHHQTTCTCVHSTWRSVSVKLLHEQWSKTLNQMFALAFVKIKHH